MACQALVRGGQVRVRCRYRDDDASVDSKAAPPTVVVRPATPSPPAWMGGLVAFQARARGSLLRFVQRPGSPYLRRSL